MMRIYLIGEIGEESFQYFCEKMDEFERIAGSHKYNNKEVEVVLNSLGGTALDAIAFMGRIKQSPLEVNVTVYGLAGSAAVLVLAACDYRRMTKESWLMVHEDEHTTKSLKTSKLELEATNARMMEAQWCQLLEGLTTTTKEVWTELHKKGDTYLTPQECLGLGIIDEII